MTTDTDPRTEKLPKWAQDRMQQLEDSAEYWKKKYHTGPDGSDTFVETYEGDGRPLGAGVAIRFDLPTGKIIASIRHGALTLLAVGTGGFGRLAVFPQASNVVSIEVPSR